MNDERDDFQAWLSEHAPSAQAQRSAADAAWERRPKPRAWLWVGGAVLAAAGLAVWIARPSTPPKTPRYDTSLVVQAAGQHVRIELGVRENEQ